MCSKWNPYKSDTLKNRRHGPKQCLSNLSPITTYYSVSQKPLLKHCSWQHTHTHTHTHINTHTHTHTHINTHTHTYAHTCTCTCTCIYHSQICLRARGPHSVGKSAGSNKTGGPHLHDPLSAVGYSSMGLQNPWDEGGGVQPWVTAEYPSWTLGHKIFHFYAW